MKARTTPRRLVPILIAVAGLLAAIATVPVESPQSGANMWARSLLPAERATYMGAGTLHVLPVVYRRALFANLTSPEDKAHFWRQVFAQYRYRHTLTAAQLALLSQTEHTLLTPATFRTTGLGGLRPDVTTAMTAISEALGPDAVRELFLTAGPGEERPAELQLVERLRYHWRVSRPKSIVAAANWVVRPLYAGSCNCQNDGECYYQQRCGSAVACELTSFGCGFWWLEACWNLCSYDPNR